MERVKKIKFSQVLPHYRVSDNARTQREPMHAVRAQAAVTDALYFLLIVTGITIFLFGFTNTYGASVDAELVKSYNVDFSTDALKTILYSSVPRDPDPSQSLYNDASEIDHLLAYVKEDFADDQTLEPKTQLVLAKNISSIMRPLADNFDYIFTISVPQGADRKYVFAFFHKTNFAAVARGSQTAGGRRDEVTVLDPSSAFSEFFCAVVPETSTASSPASGNAVYDGLKTEIDKLVANVGETSSSFSKIKLVKIQASGTVDVPAQADLVIWNPTILFAGGGQLVVDQDPPWYCVTAQELVPPPAP